MSDLLKRVYEVFDPAPLQVSQQDLYENLDDVRGHSNIVRRLADRIRLSSKPTCQLLAGHRGSGKTTELLRLQQELQRAGDDRLFAVFCECDTDVDRNDVDFPDVLIAIMRQLAAQLRERAKISLQPGYLRNLWPRFTEFMSSEVNVDQLDVEAGLLKFSTAIKSSPDARAELRKLLEPDTSNWLRAANDLIGQAKLALLKQGYRGLVILVDDLDKMILRPHDGAGCSTGEYLFVHREAQLSAFACHMVYTMPLALVYSAAGGALASLYGGPPPLVPMVKILTRPPKPKRFAEGFDKLRGIVCKRVSAAGAREADVFADDAVRDRLIELSGGQPRELMGLVREALIGGSLPIQSGAVERAARKGRRAYTRQLREEHMPILRKVAATGWCDRTNANDGPFRDLLDSRAILQYVNDEEWYAVNPLIDLKMKEPVSFSQMQRKARAARNR